MPVYLYERADGSRFETTQPITAEPLKECPNTGQKVRRVPQVPNIHFKGTGFYANQKGHKNAGSR